LNDHELDHRNSQSSPQADGQTNLAIEWRFGVPEWLRPASSRDYDCYRSFYRQTRVKPAS